ncbi:MAG: L-threonylcarbamoyladenylate synthase [Bacillota bacterium]|nr:L-threonylcarbamoyladenylate synthase [Bacillota bacterium]
METKWIKVNEISPNDYREAIAAGARLLNSGELVAFPTETVYGLGANALDPEAAAKIYAAKGRPSDNPLIVHISYIDMLDDVVAEIPPVCRRLAFEFWPGPLTMILPKNEKIPLATTGGLETVAVRMPGNGVALDLIDAAALPVAAPSANLSGKPSPTRGDHVYEDMAGRIPLLLDGGEVEIGVESTIIDLSLPEPVILRPGRISYEELKPFVPRLRLPGHVKLTEGTAPKAPGMKYRHYAPEADVVVVPKGQEGVELLSTAIQEGVCAVFSRSRWEEVKEYLPAAKAFIFTPEEGYEYVAHQLFHIFRQCDREGLKIIYIEEFPEQGLAAALMNRIRKAAAR